MRLQAVPFGRTDRAVVHPSDVRASRRHRRRRASVRDLDGGRCHPLDLRLRVALPARVRYLTARPPTGPFRGRVRAGLAGKRRVRRVQPARLRRRPPGGGRRDPAGAVPVPPPDRYDVQPGLHRADVRGQPAVASLLADAVRGLVSTRRRTTRPPRPRPHAEVEHAIDAVTTLDEDRILRMYLRAGPRDPAHERVPADAAGGRVNLSFKLESAKIPDLPLPRPHFEIFVCSPRVEGVHLRAGYVARGGIRWSDRREDFRTEVLGLMKAQTVKNAVIVPVGAKGGFVVKQPPPDRDALAAEVEACYRSFVSGLLDVTDNLVDGGAGPPDGRRRLRRRRRTPTSSSPPTRERRRSPTSRTRSRWPTASGSATRSRPAVRRATTTRRWGSRPGARGSRSATTSASSASTPTAADHGRRHRRHVGRRVRQRHAAVVHLEARRGLRPPPRLRRPRRPIPRAAYEERLRLFELPRSSWADYDASKLSAGGGVWPRTAKSIALPAEAQRVLGTAATTMTPAEARPDDPPRAGRPALERRNRDVRQGARRDQRRGRRQGERRRAGRRARAAVQASSSRAATSG